MNEQQMRAAQIRQTRRGILDTLNLAYPATLAFGTILEALLPLEVEEGYAKKDMAYLVDAGYVKRTDADGQVPWARRVFKLTKQGKDIADRLVTDEALEP